MQICFLAFLNMTVRADLLLQSLSRRGLHATALEVCKLLLKLDRRDPMGAVLCINYFAIRAHDYKFVQVRL